MFKCTRVSCQIVSNKDTNKFKSSSSRSFVCNITNSSIQLRSTSNLSTILTTESTSNDFNSNNNPTPPRSNAHISNDIRNSRHKTPTNLANSNTSSSSNYVSNSRR